MGIYLLIATFLFMGIFATRKHQEIYYKLSMFILFLFTALRDINLGGYDAENYQRFFLYEVPVLSGILDYHNDYEYGYALFNSIIKSIVLDYRIYQIFYSALAIILLHLLINKLELYKAERNLFLFVYFCYRFLWNNFVLLRQNIATLIIWITLLAFLDKPFKYYINVILSFLWHKSSIVNVLVYPLVKIIKKIELKKMLIITCIISLFFLLFSKPIFNIMLSLLVRFTGQKYFKYIAIDSDTQGFNVVNYMLKWFFILLFCFFYEKIKYPYKETLLSISFIAIILSSLNIAIVSRMVEYFMISIYTIITVCNRAFKGKDIYIYLMGIFSLFSIILVRFLFTFSAGELLNYSLFNIF